MLIFPDSQKISTFPEKVMTWGKQFKKYNFFFGQENKKAALGNNPSKAFPT